MSVNMTREERRERRREMSKEVAAKMSVPDVAQKYGVGITTVKNACREFGVDVPRVAARRSSRGRSLRIIADLINTTDQHLDIAKKHGVSRQSVKVLSHRAQKAGIPLHPDRE